MDYDISRGIDKEVTLFSDQVSVPVGDIGPISPKQLLEKSSMGSILESIVTQDEDGYLVLDDSKSSDPSYVMLLNYTIPDPSEPADVTIADFTGTIQDKAALLRSFGLTQSKQVFTLTAANPLTEDIAVSGKLTVSSQADGDTPAETLFTRELTKAAVPANTKTAEIIREERNGGNVFSGYRVESVRLHLPASILAKDPLNGLGSFFIAYKYKSFISLGADLPTVLPIPINDLKVPLGQYRVKEARICMDVVNEIPVTLVAESVELLSDLPDVETSVTPGLTIAAGCPSKPVTSPLEIVVKATEGTIPDISGLRLNIAIKAPVGVEDTRIGMNQRIYFNKIRATVSGGITIQGL